MLQLIFGLAAAAACLATTLATPATYVAIPYISNDVMYYVALMVAYGYYAFGAYVVFNVLDAVTPQTSTALYRISGWTSAIAWFSINITGAIVTFQLVSNGYLRQLSDINGALQLLYALVAFSWFDLFYLQRRKLKVLMGARLTRTVLADSSPFDGPADTDYMGGAVAIVAVLVLVGLGVLYFVGIPDSMRKQQTADAPKPPAAASQPPAVQTQKQAPAPKAKTPAYTFSMFAPDAETCLQGYNVLSTEHTERGCFVGDDEDIHCTHPGYDDIVKICKDRANAKGRPARWRN